MRRTDADKLLHAIDRQRRAQARVTRAATLLHKWTLTRKRIERRIGAAEVDRIVREHQAKWISKLRQKKTKRVIDRLANS
jgi:hypothetical protein